MSLQNFTFMGITIFEIAGPADPKRLVKGRVKTGGLFTKFVHS